MIFSRFGKDIETMRNFLFSSWFVWSMNLAEAEAEKSKSKTFFPCFCPDKSDFFFVFSLSLAWKTLGLWSRLILRRVEVTLTSPSSPSPPDWTHHSTGLHWTGKTQQKGTKQNNKNTSKMVTFSWLGKHGERRQRFIIKFVWLNGLSSHHSDASDAHHLQLVNVNYGQFSSQHLALSSAQVQARLRRRRSKKMIRSLSFPDKCAASQVSHFHFFLFFSILPHNLTDKRGEYL